MNLITAITKRPIHFLIGTVAIFLAPALLSLIVPGGANAWVATVIEQPLNLASSIGLSLLFGSFVALYAYTRSLPECCAIGTRSGFAGGVFAAFLGKCPACFSVFALILPAIGIGSSLSISIFLSHWAWAFMLIAAALIARSIHTLKGFSRTWN
jgi:hypothetical protein